MAIDVHTLLTLPSSKAFSSFRLSSVGVVEQPRSNSPPRKTPRLAADSDSASASRSRLNDDNDAGAVESKGPIVLKLQGAPVISRSPNLYESQFNILRGSIRALLDNTHVGGLPASHQQLYTACRAVVCEAQRGEGLYENVKISLEQCVGRTSGAQWLQPFVEACEWFEKRVQSLESLLAYLDRSYVYNHKELQPTRKLAYDLFADRIFGTTPLVGKLHEGIKQWVEWERQMEAEHEIRPVIAKLVSRLEHHNQYQSVFEDFYLKVTHEFYTEESQKLRDSVGASQFVTRCKERDIQEQSRYTAMLLPISWDKVKDTTRRAQLLKRLDWIAAEAIPPYINERNAHLLRETYVMFSAVGGLKVLQQSFKLQVENSVRTIVKNTADEEHMVPQLLAFKAFCDKLVAEVFLDEVKIPQVAPSRASGSAVKVEVEVQTEQLPNREFGYAMIDAFAKGFRSRRNKPAELIAKYIDKAMRKGQKGRDDKDYSAELDAALGLYRFTEDKDVFRAFYHRALAKRLLLEKSASDDHEKAMLKKLKELYDPEFGMGDHMFTDLSLSRDLMKEYSQPRPGAFSDTSGHKVSVMVLQHSVWPFAARKRDVALPEWMGEELQAYMNFYKKKHSGHKLDWDHGLGTATLRARFKAGEKELSVSLYQAIILLLFNEDEKKPFSEIKMLTQMEDDELRRTLQSLACGKKRVLKKQPPGKDVNDGDMFIFNADFTDTAFRVHINSIQVKETAEETKRTQSLIEGDRKYALDAAIVRIMKGKKQLPYEQLKTATIDAVKQHFKPDVAMIKQRVDNLVEQDYLRRDDDDMTLLVYVA
ncbi:Cullin-domain-containing protein [Cytidiella melzeri]|nr:Cullin-domain-containing protein [Cytidiella melzeri]